MANLVTLSRLVLLFLLVGLALWAPPAWQLVNAPLLIVIVFLDTVDGWVARLFAEESKFGSIFDIMADRIVENVLWIVLAYLDLAPLWAALVVVTRSIVVDSIRYPAAASHGAVFDVMQTAWGRWLVGGRFMRGFYGTAKATTFAWLLALQPLPALWPGLWAQAGTVLVAIGNVLIVVTIASCLARGIPVVVEALLSEGRVVRGPARRVARRRRRTRHARAARVEATSSRLTPEARPESGP
ncbi:MAG: CDP-alcohol phosphatidyltransferase family protein [Planctomycetota bacterium]|jgi:CDP-diacylglycerol--glycerol-3-phosphate 3-phosphatidyltransferase